MDDDDDEVAAGEAGPAPAAAATESHADRVFQALALASSTSSSGGGAPVGPASRSAVAGRDRGGRGAVRLRGVALRAPRLRDPPEQRDLHPAVAPRLVDNSTCPGGNHSVSLHPHFFFFFFVRFDLWSMTPCDLEAKQSNNDMFQFEHIIA